MTRSLLLFTHIAGVLALFSALALEWAAVPRKVLGRLYGLAFLAILVTGFWMTSRLGVHAQAWVRISLITMIVMAVVGRVWRDARWSIALRIVLGLGVVFLMISKAIV